MLVGVVQAVEQDLGLVLVGADVVADLGRPQLAALVAVADREQVDDAPGGRRRPPGCPRPSRGRCGSPSSRPGSRRGGERRRGRDGRDEERRWRSTAGARGGARVDACDQHAASARPWRPRPMVPGPSGGDAGAGGAATRHRLAPNVDLDAPSAARRGRRLHGSPAMTAERIKITYATLRADNEELQVAVRGRPRARQGAGSAQFHRNFVDGHGAGRRRDVRGPLADRQRHPRRHVREGHPRRRPGRDRGGAAGAAGLVPARLGGAARDPEDAPPS